MTAAARQRDGDQITLGQGRALIEAAQWAGMSAEQLAVLMVGVTGCEAPERLTRRGWADLMNRFVAGGFRHPAVPMVTAVQLATLDEMRRALGMEDRGFVGLVRRIGGVASRHRLDGAGFLAVWGWLARAGAVVPVPGHGFMSRVMVRTVHEAAYQQGMDAGMLVEVLAEVGGVLRASQLDEQAFVRLALMFQARGFVRSAAAPRVPGDPGMVTQAQANLLWRLWVDVGGWKGDVSPAALDAAISSLLGSGGGLATLTRRGAAMIIDRFMVPRLNDRSAAEAAMEPPAEQDQAREHQLGPARRRTKGGRR